MSLLSVENLTLQFKTSRGVLHAIDDISFELEAGETLGIVGESGCGKTATALSIMRLIPSPPANYTRGKILFENRNLLSLQNREMRAVRGSDISMIFQEPMTSLNPVFTVGEQILETICLHQKVSRKVAKTRAIEIMQRVSIPDAEERFDYYPYQMSGGLRQRIMIAMALSCRPKLLIADEPTTALDVTIQAQILHLIKELQREFQMAMIIITHDFGVIAETADRVHVMYAGKIAEKSGIIDIFDAPQHPYTVGLQKSIPSFATHEARLYSIPGIVPNLTSPPKGCRFYDRCEFRQAICSEANPELKATLNPTHTVACYFPQAKQ